MTQEYQTHTLQAFTIVGKKLTITKTEETKTIAQFWDEFRVNSDYLKDISNPQSQMLHVVYYNYTESGYDMLVGLKSSDSQNSKELITLNIPTQNYLYDYQEFESPQTIQNMWADINSNSEIKTSRTKLFDLEFYSPDYKNVSVAVGIK